MPPTPLQDIVTHHDCQHNEWIGLTSRHITDNNPAPDWLEHTRSGTNFIDNTRLLDCGLDQSQVMGISYDILTKWIDGRQVTPITYHQVIDKFTGRKRKALIRAHVQNSHSLPKGRGESFVKVDYYTEDVAMTKAPRMIQYRGPAFNLELATWLEPAEHELLGGPGIGPTKTPNCSKGMTPKQRARYWMQKRYSFKHPVCLKADFSKFDAHVHTHVLKLEHTGWRKLCPGINTRLLRAQLRNNMRSKGGHKYIAVGTRMSGDRNTGGGNSLINVVLCYTIAKIANVKIEMLCDGDDSLIWMEASDFDKFARVAHEVFPKVYGMRWEYERVSTQDDEEYCHSKVVYHTDGEPYCYRDPVRVLERLLWTPKGVRGFEACELLIAKALCERVASPCVTPIVQCTEKILDRLGWFSEYRFRTPVAREYMTNMVHRGYSVMEDAGKPNKFVDDQVRVAFQIDDSMWKILLEHSKLQFHPSLEIRKLKVKQKSTKIEIPPNYDLNDVLRPEE